MLDAQGNAFLLPVDVENLHFDMLADLEKLARMGQPRPGHVGHMEQPVDSVEVDERAKIRDILHRPADPVADVDAAQESVALFRAFLLDDLSAAENDVFPVLVDLDDLEIVGVADEALQILGRNDVDLGSGQKGLDADVDREAAFYHGLDLSLDEALVLENGNDLFPILAGGGFFLRKDHHPLIVFKPLQQDLDLITNFNFRGVFEFARGDDSFAFVTNVHEKLAWPDFENMPLYDATLAVIFNRTGNQFLQVCHNGDFFVLVGVQ